MINIDGFGLALAMKTGISLLVEFEAPIDAEPDYYITTGLEIEVVSGGIGMWIWLRFQRLEV